VDTARAHQPDKTRKKYNKSDCSKCKWHWDYYIDDMH